jgi:hypothetical protein
MHNVFGSCLIRIPVRRASSEYREKAAKHYDQRGLMFTKSEGSSRLMFFRGDANPVLATVGLDLPFGDRVLGPREAIENPS